MAPLGIDVDRADYEAIFADFRRAWGTRSSGGDRGLGVRARFKRLAHRRVGPTIGRAVG